MKKLFSTLAILLLCCSASFAQQITAQTVFLPLSSVPQPPTMSGPPSVVGQPGSSTYYFWFVSNFTIGNSAPSPVGAPCFNAPQTLTSGNYCFVSWNKVVGAASYDVLMTTTPTQPSGACNCAVTTATSSTSINVQSNSLSSYTVTTVNPNSFLGTIDNEPTGAGTSKITLRINGVEQSIASVAWGSITGTLSSQSDLNTALGLKAPLASPALTGTPTAPTATVGTNTTQLATTAFVLANAVGVPCSLTALSLQFNNGGAFGCLPNATYVAATGVLSLGQLANSNNTFFMSRFTDTSPTGNFITLQNAAKNSNLFNVDVSGNVTAAGSVSVGGATQVLTAGITGAFEFTETSGSLTPTASKDGCNAFSTNHGFECSINDGASFFSAMNYPPNTLSTTWYVAGGGTAQAQTATLSPAVAALSNGLMVSWLPTAANSAAAPTLAVNGLTAKPITKLGTTALVANDLTTAAIAIAVYDGTEFQLQNPQTTTTGLTQETLVYANGMNYSVSPEWYPIPLTANVGPSATESFTQAEMPGSGTIKNFYVNGQTIAAASTVTLTLRKNAASTALTCTVTASTGACSDTAHSVTFVATDLLDWQIDYTGTPGNLAAQIAFNVTN